MNLLLVDIRAYLDSQYIEYRESGKNISSGWIGIACPFCPDEDPSTHLGIDPETNLINCWRCGKKGSVIELVRYHQKCSYTAAENVLSQFSRASSRDLASEDKSQAIAKSSATVTLPSECEKSMLALHQSFLVRRGFSPHKIYEKYDLSCVDKFGKYKFRLIIPIIMRGQLVAFTSRDVTGLSDNPYRHASNEECVIPVKSCLYNIDTVKDTVIIAEGPLDVWNLGDASVCTFGTQYTRSQVKLLTSKCKRAHVLFDSDATTEASSLAFDLSAHIEHVEIIELDQGDPADMTLDDVRALRREIFGKIF